MTATAGPAHKQITVSADIPSGAQHTTVYYSSDGVTFYGLKNFFQGDPSSYTSGNWGTNKTWYFYAQAVSSCGSTNSGTTSATTFDIDPPTITAVPGPLHKQITVSTNVPTGADSTSIRFSSDGVNFSGLQNFYPNGTTTYTSSNWGTNKTWYFYAITTSDGRTKQSATISATTFDIDPPTITAVPGPLHKQVTVSTNIPTGADSTSVRYSSDGVNFSGLQNFYPNGTTTYTSGGWGTNKTWYVYAIATSAGRTKQSPTVTVTTFDIEPPIITAVAGSGVGKITVGTNIPTGADSTSIRYSSDGVNFYNLQNFFPNGTNTYTSSNWATNQTWYFYAIATSAGRTKQSEIVAVPLYSDQDAGANSCPFRGATVSVGGPVNVINGNMYLQQTDYQLPGIGSRINISRTYNSIIQSSGLFGLGWSTQYDEKITLINNLSLRFGMPDGRAVYFARLGTTAPFKPSTPDFYGQIVLNVDNTYTATFTDGSVHQFNASGKLLWLKDRNNNQTTLTYNGAGQLTAVTDLFGRILTVVPNSNGTIQQLSDAIGVIAGYEYYSGTTRLKTVTYNDGSKFKFEYTTVGSIYYLATVKDALDNVLETHQYDSSGRATTSEKDGGVEKYTLDYSNVGYTKVTDALGRITKYYYDLNSGRNFVKQIEGNCSCGSSQTTTYQYDNKLNIIKKTDALLNETSYTYDSNGNRLSMTDILGTETYTYNNFAQLLTRTDRIGGVTTNTYDSNGNLLTTKDALNNTATFTYTTLGQLETIKNARNNTTTFAYDTQGRLTQVKDPYNKTTNYAYDARARRTSVTNALNETASYEYDLNNRLKKIIYPDTNFITFTYDLAGRRTALTDARGNTTSYAYDNDYRLTTVTDALNHAVTSSYDLMSNRISQVDALGNTTNYEYDDFNRLKKVIYPPATISAVSTEERLEYDLLGNVKKRIDTANRETVYDYDNAYRLIKVTDPNLKLTQLEYNARKQVTKVKDALNQEYVFTYDALGRQLSQTHAGSTMSFEYDAVGNKTKRTDYTGLVTNYIYDNLNRLTSIDYVNQSSDNAVYAYDDLSRLVSAINYAGTVSFAYDSRGRLTSSTDVYNKTVEYDYDANGNRTSMDLDGTLHSSYSYDVANRLTTLTDEDNQNFTFAYDIANKLISKTLPNGVTTGYGYDGMSRLTRLKDETSSTVLFDRQYSYNTANQISQIAEPVLTRNFSYDNLNRLTDVSDGTNSIENYGFDEVGNRTASHLSTSYLYQSFNRMTATANANFGYNANGSMISKNDASVNWTYNWDYENRMTNASDGTSSINYEYDALGKLTKRVDGSHTTKYTYDGLNVVMDDDSVTGVTKYQNGLGVDNKLKMVTNGKAEYFLTDHLGSTNGLVDASGNVDTSSVYDSFGNAAGNLNTRYQFTGREFDTATGFYYYRGRWYDANLGRFISEDPLGFGGEDVNLFSYVKNNPLFYKDPLGLISNPYYNFCVGGWTTAGSVIGFVSGGGLGLLTGPAAVITSPLGVVAGTAVGGAVGAGIGSLACGTPPYLDQSDSLPRTSPPPFSKPKDCDAKPRSIPYHIDKPWEPQPYPDRDGCAEEISDCTVLCSEVQFDPDRKKVWGGSMRTCMKGCVTPRCQKGTWLE
jgi:RHS repeat-associated protein